MPRLHSVVHILDAYTALVYHELLLHVLSFSCGFTICPFGRVIGESCRKWKGRDNPSFAHRETLVILWGLEPIICWAITYLLRQKWRIIHVVWAGFRHIFYIWTDALIFLSCNNTNLLAFSVLSADQVWPTLQLIRHVMSYTVQEHWAAARFKCS